MIFKPHNNLLVIFLGLLLSSCSSPATSSASISPTPEPIIIITPTAVPATPTPTLGPTTLFAVIGDYGSAGKDLEYVAALVKSWEPEFIVTVGDNNYPSGKADTIDENIGQYFHEYIYPYIGQYGTGADINRFFPVLGNHDWKTPGAKPYLDYFELPGNERYYDVDWGAVHLFIIDSDSHEPDKIGLSSDQAAWLKTSLNASNASWKLVFMHHPPYSSGMHGSQDALQWPYKEWGADAVIAGHDHDYERLTIDGLPYFVNGLGGQPNRYPFEFTVPGSGFRYRETHGAMLLEATVDKILFQFFNVNNQLIDSYTIIK